MRFLKPAHQFQWIALRAVLLSLLLPGVALPQGFTSGSNGSDGALNLTTPGTIVFDPRSFNPPLDPEGDCIFNFTSGNIASGVVLKLSGQILPCPIVFLFQTNLTITGVIDLSGENGHTGTAPSTSIPGLRKNSIPGSGGFPGGMGGSTKDRKSVV